jgi:hypothetical protein
MVNPTTIACVSIIGALLGLAALPPALKERSWKKFFIAVPLTLVGILLPLFIFVGSALLVPDWKGGCRFGWLDCFHVGKLALTPLVLWASAAWYAVEVYRVTNRTRTWLVLGFCLGALVSSICFVFGLVSTEGLGRNGLRCWLLVPLYVSLGYSLRAAQLMKLAGLKSLTYLAALVSSLPFWIGSVIWSRKAYSSLPDHPPTCFVVTAAARGHSALVGPFVEVLHHGCRRKANHQLLTLWQFEIIWRTAAPRSHSIFRRFYNRLGPVIARRITQPWLADLAYLAIRPAEILARGIVRCRKL